MAGAPPDPTGMLNAPLTY